MRGRGGAVDGDVQTECLSAEGAIDRDLERLPVRVVANWKIPRDQIERGAEAARARDRPTTVPACDGHVVATDGQGADEHHELRWRRGRNLLALAAPVMAMASAVARIQ
jgi:hypothetical protein